MTARRSHVTRGFTLVEVLIAATILFTAMAVISESFRASLAASRRADDTVQLLTPLPLIVETIASELRNQPDASVQGEGALLGVDYRFEANTLAFDPPLPRFDPDLGELIIYAPRYRLYEVSLVLVSGSRSRAFRYRELAWSGLSQ